MSLAAELIRVMINVNILTKILVWTTNLRPWSMAVNVRTNRQTGQILYPRPLTEEGITRLMHILFILYDLFFIPFDSLHSHFHTSFYVA